MGVRRLARAGRIPDDGPVSRRRITTSIAAGDNDLGTIRVCPELFEKQDGL